MKNEMIITNEILNDEQLDIVTGGTFTSNKFSKKEYRDAGIRIVTNFFERDEFFALSEKNGQEYPITYDQANWAVAYWKQNPDPNKKWAPYEMILHAMKK